jgi:hypothetical protein
MKQRTVVMQTVSPGKLIKSSSPVRISPPSLESLIERLPVTSLETSGAYRMSPTRQLVRLPVSSPREGYREDVEKMHLMSPIRAANQLMPESDPPSRLISPSRIPTSHPLPESIRKQLSFEETNSPLSQSIYSERISSHVSEARNLLRSLRGSPSKEPPAVKKCLQELKTATAALAEIGKVIGKTAQLLTNSANFLDKSVEAVSLPGYYRRHEYPHSHRLMHSPS